MVTLLEGSHVLFLKLTANGVHVRREDRYTRLLNPVIQRMSASGQEQTSAPARKWSAVCGGADVPSRGQGWGQHRYPGPRQRLAGKAIRLIDEKGGRFAS